MIKTRSIFTSLVALGLGVAMLGTPVASDDPVKWKDPSFWNDPSVWNSKELYDPEEHKSFMTTIDEAMGHFDDIEIWKPRNSDDEEWQLANGTYIPVTVNGDVPSEYKPEMRSDRPMMLPTAVQGFHGGNGQSNPYSVVGRMPGSNPEVQWVFLVRKYYTKELTDPTFTQAGDVAVIGHHPRTGASTYFQFYHPQEPKDARIVKSPFSGEEGMYFWSPLITNAEFFQCQRCHNADPFLHTPWISQAKVSDPTDDNPFPENMVPANPLGPFFFVDTDDGLFEPWDSFLVHMDNPQSTCTECHRATPYDGAGLYENSTLFEGLGPDHEKYNPYGWEMNDKYQTPAFQDLPWMPPVDLGDFYAGQELVKTIWKEKYAKDAAFINKLSQVGEAKVDNINATPAFTAAQKATLKAVPQPAGRFKSVMVDRPFTDEFPANSAGVMILDSRMKANTDGALVRWRFVQSNADENARAVPVVFEKVWGNGSEIQYRILHMGPPRDVSEAQDWQSIADGAYPLKQGQYLGLHLYSEGSDTSLTRGMVPFTEDNYLKITGADGTLQYPEGVVTYRSLLKNVPNLNDTITFSDTNYVTYSFEMQNDL